MIYVDMGFDCVKSLYNEESRVSPSKYSQPVGDMAGFGKKLNSLHYNGITRLVGSDSIYGSVVESPRDSNWVLGDPYMALLLDNVYHLTGKSYKGDIFVGLPYRDHKKLKNVLKSRLEGAHYYQKEGEGCQAVFDNVWVSPQNFAPILGCGLVINNGKVENKGRFGVVGLGGNTVELAGMEVLDDSTGGVCFQPLGDVCFSKPYGITSLLPKFRSELSNMGITSEFENSELIMALESGKLFYNNEMKEIHSLTSNLNKIYFDQILSIVKNNFHDGSSLPLDKMSKLIVTGGKGQPFHRYALKSFSFLYISKSPQMDTVKGYREIYDIK